MLSLFCFVHQQDYAKAVQPIFKIIGGKVVHGPRKNPLDFAGNPDPNADPRIFEGIFFLPPRAMAVLRTAGL